MTESLDPEDFPYQLQEFARDVKTFLDCLNEFPEFTDEAVNSSILSLEGDLKVSAKRNINLNYWNFTSIHICSIGLHVLRPMKVKIKIINDEWSQY